MKDKNLTWNEVKLLVSIIGATATIVTSVVMTFSRLDYKVDLLLQRQENSAKDIQNVQRVQIEYSARLTRIETIIEEAQRRGLLSKANKNDTLVAVIAPYLFVSQ